MWFLIVLFLIEAVLGVLSLLLFWEKSRRTLSGVKRRAEEGKEGLERRKRSLNLQEEENASLERRISELVELYELTKKVSISLEFQEVFATLSQILSSNFSFEKGYLFLFREESEEGGAVHILDEIYSLKPAENSGSSEEALMKVGGSEISYLGEILAEGKEQKEAFQGKSSPFTAVPLWVKDRLISMLVCERLRPEEVEKFTILSRQFALVIQKVKLYERLQELAITDGLTHLYSRRYFLERFGEELERSKRHELHLSFLMADIDHFKQKNDQYGHLVGDVVLREVAALLKANVREIDLVGRYGGEEFSIALPDTGIPEALQVAERIRKAVEERTFTAYDEATHVTISIGVGAYPEDGAKVVVLIEAADAALYHAKQTGRNRVCSATPGLETGKVEY